MKERDVRSVLGLTVPRIFAFDDRFYAIEMSLVHVPCIIDFGGAYLNSPPDHMQRDETWLDEKAEEFGKSWDAAQSVIRELEFRADLWLSDVNTGNIKFPP